MVSTRVKNWFSFKISNLYCYVAPSKPWSAKLAAALGALDWEQVHRALIPNVWNRIKLATFTETWAVLGVWAPAPEDAAKNPRRRVVLEAYGTGGLTHAMKHLRADDIQYIALRVELPGGGSRWGSAR
jgi:hypothetical protein